jgi:hypothetical protein
MSTNGFEANTCNIGGATPLMTQAAFRYCDVHIGNCGIISLQRCTADQLYLGTRECSHVASLPLTGSLQPCGPRSLSDQGCLCSKMSIDLTTMMLQAGKFEGKGTDGRC